MFIANLNDDNDSLICKFARTALSLSDVNRPTTIVFVCFKT